MIGKNLIEVYVEPEFAIVNFYAGAGENSLDWSDRGLHSTAENAVSIAVDSFPPGSHLKVVICSSSEKPELPDFVTLLKAEMNIDEQGLQISDVVHASCDSEPGDLGDWIKIPYLGCTEVIFCAQKFKLDTSGNKVPKEIWVILDQKD